MTAALALTLYQRLSGIAYGGDYNPEQWDRPTWAEDVQLMREAGVNLVTLGVFSWASLEPREGEFSFGWLDDVIDLLWSHGIAIDLATPNASPPPWLAAYEETLLVERDGRRVSVGSRGHFCPSSPIYRERSQRVARALAERYGSHPALALWHVGNEYHAHCFCDLCDERFRGWLRQKYGSLDELNLRWGTTFWSQTYDQWGQVHLPTKVRGSVNPTRELDFSRFTSDIQRELFVAERDILRAATPSIPITTNFMAFFPLVDYRRWAKDLDIVALDMYPDPAKPDSLAEAGFQYDLMRSLRDGQPWLLLEQAAGAVSQWQVNVTKSAQRMRLGSFQAVAHGADAVMFFQWRASRYGQEKFHSAMLPHGGTDTETWSGVRSLGHELRSIADVVGAGVPASAAIVYDWDNRWAVEGSAHPLNTFSYRDAVMRHYRGLWRAGVSTDVISLDQDLSTYRLLVIPHQYLLRREAAAAVERFVFDGGHAVISYFSGIVDESDHVTLPGYAPYLRRVIGAHIRDLSAMEPDQSVDLLLIDDLAPTFGVGRASTWQDEIALETGTALARYATGRLAGRPAIVENRFGRGRAIYLGTELDEELLDRVIGDAADRAGVRGPFTGIDDVEVVVRASEQRQWMFLMNHGSESQLIPIGRTAIERLTGRRYRRGDRLLLKAEDVAVLVSPLEPNP